MYKILIADDEPDVVSLIKDFFELEGYLVLTARDGAEAVAAVSKAPDLILLDGGTGHVHAVAPLLKEFGLDIPLFGMVKDDKHRTRAIAAGGHEIQINNVRAVFDLVTRIQDEVHRFSVSFMHKKHKKKTYSSELLSVRGIGEKKAAKLMIKYKTRENLLSASPQELAQTAGVNIETAKELWRVLHN